MDGVTQQFLIALVAPEQTGGERGMGVMLAFFMPFIYAIPVLSLALVAWAAYRAAQRSS